MNIKLTHLNDKAIFNIQVNPNTRRRKSQKLVLANRNVENYLRKNYDLDEYKYLKNESDTHDLTIVNTVGRFVFKKTNIDILKDNVKINQVIEAESPQVEEQEKQASLPNGLKKITKTKRKRATKNKKTEE
tara:strand:- start:282 stop:674 length:393 start_codon:yes stop_codon:yes gene_type:complete